MTVMIFFGGLMAGFLIGWIGMAILTMSSVHNRDDLMEQGSAMHEDCGKASNY